MLETQTLAQLKAENAAAEETETTVPQTEEEGLEVQASEEETGETQQVAEPGEEETGETELEAWQIGDEQGSQEDQPVVVPVAAHAAMRAKLKGKLGERDEAIEQLKAEIEALKSAKTPVTARTTPRPKAMDFATDEDYEDALDTWYEAKVDQKLETVTQTTTQRDSVQKEIQRVQSAVDQHYGKAAELVQAAGISVEVYQQADQEFRSILDQAYPGEGDAVADNLIARMGEGSEKVVYYLSRNATAKTQLRAHLASDPSGFEAAMFLGRKLEEVVKPKKRVSQAPKPAANANGDTTVSSGVSAKKLKSAYDKADKSGDTQARWNARKAARKEGIDVSNW